MTSIERQTRALIAEARRDGRSLKWVTRKCRVNYHTTAAWLRSRTRALSVDNADKILRALRGRGLE